MKRVHWAISILTVTFGLAATLLTVSASGLVRLLNSPATGDIFPIAAVPVNDELNAAVAYDEGRQQYLVVNENNSTINGTCKNISGDTVASYAFGSGTNPDVTFGDGPDQYLVVWDDTGDIEGATVNGACLPGPGSVIPLPTAISNDRPDYEAEPAVAYNRHDSHQDYLVVWQDTSGISTHWAIYARLVNSVTVSGGSFPITDTTHAFNYHPDVAYNLNMNEYLVVYVNDPSKGMDQDARDIYGRRVYNTGGGGLLAEHPIDTSAYSQNSPAVAAYRLNYTTPYLVVFQDHWNDPAGDIRGYLVGTDGWPYSLVNISTAPGILEEEPDVTISEDIGKYTVVWAEDYGKTDHIYGRHVSPDGDVESVFPVQVALGDRGNPAVAGGLPAPLAVWQVWNGSDNDVYARFLFRRIYLPLVLRNYLP